MKRVETKKKRDLPIVNGLKMKLDPAVIDKRTRLGKAITFISDQLRAYVGEGNPVTEILIERITYKTIKLCTYEITHYEHLESEEKALYLPMSNSLRLDLQTLAGLAGKPVQDAYKIWRERFLEQGDKQR